MPFDDYDYNEDLLFYLMFGNQKPVRISKEIPTFKSTIESQPTTEERLSTLDAMINYALDCGNKEEFMKYTEEKNAVLKVMEV